MKRLTKAIIGLSILVSVASADAGFKMCEDSMIQTIKALKVNVAITNRSTDFAAYRTTSKALIFCQSYLSTEQLIKMEQDKAFYAKVLGL